MSSTIAKGSRPGIGVFHSDADAAPKARVAQGAREVLAECAIIAAVNKVERFESALDSPARAIYLLFGNPLILPAMLVRAREREKVCLINIDFLDGLARDRHAVEFLAAHHVDGIVSTRVEVLKAAQSLGLVTVQRTFAIDSAAMSATLKSLHQFLPDAMEVLPAMAAPKAMRHVHRVFPQMPIIGGGLIENVREIEQVLEAGVRSVSVSDPRMWVM